MSGSKQIRSLVCAFVFCLVAMTASAASYETLEITPVSPIPVFENSLRYQITYWSTVAGQKFQVFPTRSEKEADFDLILAAVVRQYLQDHYFAHGKFLDETDVKSASPQEIAELVATEFISPAWGKGNTEELKRYMQAHSNFLSINKLVAYLDYQDKGGFYSGIDVNPVLYRFGASPEANDEVTIINVVTTNE